MLYVFSMFSKLMSQASQFAMEGVKNLVVKKHVSFLGLLYLDIYWSSDSSYVIVISSNQPPVSRHVLVIRFIIRHRH